MAQRLVLRAKEGTVPLSELRRFVETAEEYGAGGASASYDLEKKELRIMLSLPKDVRVVDGRKVKIKPKTKRQQAVDEQIKEHKESKKSGKGEGYVPPVGRKTPPKGMKVKCPVCDTKKAVVKVSGVESVKPHISRGEPCLGSGAQVVSAGRGKGKVAVDPRPQKKTKKKKS